MTEPLLTRCYVCKHFRGAGAIKQQPGETATSFAPECEAYPYGIPLKVLTWNEPHTTPRDDQLGDFVFEEDSAAVAANPGIPDIIEIEEV